VGETTGAVVTAATCTAANKDFSDRSTKLKGIDTSRKRSSDRVGEISIRSPNSFRDVQTGYNKIAINENIHNSFSCGSRRFAKGKLDCVSSRSDGRQRQDP
jgi:hypothetical protein